MFSEELYELDRNTVQYMIDEMQDELDAKQVELNTVNSELNAAYTELDEAYTELDEAHTELNEAHTKLDAVHTELDEMGIKYKQSIKNTVKVLRDIGLPDQEIVDRICGLYQFDEKQAKEYL